MAAIPQSGLTKEIRAHLIARLQDFFREEREETLRELPAQMLLDFIEKEIGPYFHNQGVREAKVAMERQWERVLDDVDLALRIPAPKRTA